MSLENPKVPVATKKAIDYIDAFLQPGDPSPGDLRQQQYWQWTFTLGLEELAKDQRQVAGYRRWVAIPDRRRKRTSAIRDCGFQRIS